MFLKSLEIQGFKSFPDKVVVTYGNGITAVVGPNGSGKSNISDALRWVLGEQSTKTLRGSRMEDVIFNGTATRRGQGFAQVTVCFDNRDRMLPMDSDEVRVTRRYYRSGESEYRINNAAVRLKDVNELFMDTGVGRDGYSMISQGKIQDIVSARSQDRRDMFEEAAGISRYRYRKTEAERRLSQAEENLVRLRDIFGELESRVGPLREQNEKAQRFLALSAEKRELEIGLWLISLEQSKEKLREQEHRMTLASLQYDETGSALRVLEEETEQCAAKIQDLTVSIDELRRAAGAYEEEAARVDGEIAVSRNTIFHHGETIARLQAEMDTVGRSGKVEDDLARCENSRQDKQAHLEELKVALEQSAGELEGLLRETEGYSAQYEAVSRQLGDLSQSLSQETVRQVTAEAGTAEIVARLETVQAELIARTLAAQQAQDELKALEADRERILSVIEENRNAAAGIELLLGRRQETAQVLKKQVESLDIEGQTKLRRAQMLEDMERSLEGFAHSVRTVMKETERGSLRGIRGPVSRLIQPQEPYAVAVETALGGALQHVVTETASDAKRAIGFLKTAGGGRATFLPMNEIRGRRLEQKGLSDEDGFVGLAVDLVRFDPAYTDIAAYLLGRTAVAQDLDRAVEIARRYGYRFRVVTLDGQVINTGGSLTGGSADRGAGLLRRAGEIRRIREEAAAAKNKMAALTDQLRDAVAEVAAQEARLKATQSEGMTAQEDRIRLEGEQRRVQGQREAEQNALQALEEEKRASMARLEENRRILEQAQAAQKDYLAQISQLENELSHVMGGREQLTQLREQLTERNASVRLEMVAVQKDIEQIDNEMRAVAARRQDALGRIQSLQQEIERYEGQIAEEEKAIVRRTEQAAALRVQAEQSAVLIEQKSAERVQWEAQAQQRRISEREHTAQREQLSGEIARLTERRDVMSAEYDGIIARLYDQYELTRSEAEGLGIVLEDAAHAKRCLGEIKTAIRALGDVSVSAIEEYKEVSQRYEFLKAQIDDVESSKRELERLIGELTSSMKSLFIDKFDRIRRNFTETFTDLFGGGSADLQLSDESDVLQAGIDICVQLPGKNLSHIEQLSGGEKSLVAIALYFAMMKVNPPPFCMLDEVESALDDVNVDRFAAYLRRMCTNTQFIVITHRRGSMEEADVLYGVTMQEKGVSKVLELDVSEVEKKLKLNA